jgi:cation/acetate symporter
VLPVVAVVAVTAATIAIGALGVRVARTTSDFFVAARTVPPVWNASAISGEYLSAASFLGVAGLVMKYGVDMLWYPVGYAAGYLVLLLFVAAPLRRFGAYTIPDFAEGRLASLPVRRVACGFVLLIGWFYLLPQMKGAGVTLSVLIGTPYWVGVVVVGGVITANVALGGMRGITFVQAFQYWVKVTAISVPAIVLLAHWQRDDMPPLIQDAPPVFAEATAVEVDVDAVITVDEAVTVQVSGGGDGDGGGEGTSGGSGAGSEGEVDGRRVAGPLTLEPGDHEIASGTVLAFPAGAAAPHDVDLAAADGAHWGRPFGPIGGEEEHPLFFTYSLILATFLGTMGLPHILVRFYTNPDGRAARQTTVIVLAMLGAFYVFPAVYGVLGRLYAPELLLTGRTDAVVLVLPERVVPGLPGELLAALVAAGAFAAFLSTASGLLVLVAGALSQDVIGSTTVAGFRRAAAIGGAVALVLGLSVEAFDINRLVGWAFAIAASSFCPLLVLGIWWRGLSARGALAGLLAGGGSSSAAILSTMLGVAPGGWAGSLLGQPAAWTVPLAFAVMVVVSRRTPSSVPPDVGRTMLTLHTPEHLGLGARRSG